MSSQALARKWRPQNFEQLMGQEHVLKALINALDNERLHHAYLFSGTRGVGKTTIARILAKCLNCEQGVSAIPCGTCHACTAINEGRFVDLIEVDAASRTKVEDTRELLENVQYAPTQGRFKVYLIDEVHMLSGHSFNALLKTLEEPPEHVKFLLATTDPQKLPITVLSRCLQFNLKNMLPEQIVEHLKHILAEEKINYEAPALWNLSRAANGSMRDALSLLDQAIAYSNSDVSETHVRALLGTIEQTHLINLLTALNQQEATSILNITNQLAQQAADFTLALEDLLSLFHQVALAQAVPEAIDDNTAYKEEVLELAKQLNPADIQLFYQIGLIGRRDLPLAPTPKSGFDMILLRMLAFQPVAPSKTPPVAQSTPVASNSKQNNTVSTQSVQSTPKQASAPEQKIQSAPSTPEQSTSKQTSAPVQKVQNAPSTPEQKTMPLQNKQQPEPEEKTMPLQNKQQPEPEEKTTPQPQTKKATNPIINWATTVGQLNLKGVTAILASHCVMKSFENNQLHLLLAPEQAPLLNPTQEKRLQEALQEHVGNPIKLNITIEASNALSPADEIKQAQDEKQQAAQRAIEKDPNIQAIIEQFNGTIQSDSVKPIETIS